VCTYKAYTRCSIYNETLTTTVFSSFSYINFALTNEFFYSFYLLQRTYRIASQQMLKMSITFSKTNINRKFCYQSVYCLIQHFLDRMQTAKCSTNSNKRYRCEVMCSRLHKFAPGVSTGLATRVTFTRESRWRLGDTTTRGWTCL
jgi:hypothetical protein